MAEEILRQARAGSEAVGHAMSEAGQWLGRQAEQKLPGRRDAAGEERLARALGWFSIGLGLAETAMPTMMARAIGVEDDKTARLLLRGFGLREMASGIGILLAGRRPAGWLWARVGGDAMDLALLGLALSSARSHRGRAAAATAAVVGVTALDVLCGMQLSRGAGGATRGDGKLHAKSAITINRPPEEIYRFWRDFTNLPRFMSHLEEVRITGERRSHWRARGPAGVRAEWDAEIIEDVPNERIAWRSLEGADVANSGLVTFRPGPGGRGTEVRVELRYAPPGGAIGGKVLELLGEAPGQQVREELRSLKQFIETGEIARSGASFGWLSRAARPPEV